jgi:hypothetical protein
MEGIECKRSKAIDADEQVDISALPSGMYIVNLFLQRGKIVQQKLIIP